MDPIENPFSDAGEVVTPPTSARRIELDVSNVWDAFSGHELDLRLRLPPTPRTPLHLRRLRMRPLSVDATKTVHDHPHASDSACSEAVDLKVPPTSTRMANGSPGCQKASSCQYKARWSSSREPTLICNASQDSAAICNTKNHPKQQSTSRSRLGALLKHTETIEEQDLVRSHWNHFQSLAQADPVALFEVVKETRSLVQKILEDYTGTRIPNPYFIILADASLEEEHPSAGQLSDANVLRSHICPTATMHPFAGVVLTVLSYNRHGENGLIGRSTPDLGSDVRFFQLPRATKQQMFNGTSWLVPSSRLPWTTIEAMLVHRPPLLRRLTRPAVDYEIVESTDFLRDEDLPRPLAGSVCDILRKEAQACAVRHGNEMGIIKLDNRHHSHVHDGWLVLMEGFLHAPLALEDTMKWFQAGGPLHVIHNSWQSRFRTARSFFRAELEREVCARLDRIDGMTIGRYSGS